MGSKRRKVSPKTSLSKDEYELFIAPYKRALKHVLISIEDYKNELELQSRLNPEILFPITLEEPKCRIKGFESAISKCRMKTGKSVVTVDMLRDNIFDIAGIRLITDFEDNVFKIADALIPRLRLNVIATKDYINNPKPSGYRSLHIIVQREIYFNGKTNIIPVEIQIRTCTMDFWSKLEHKLQYKQNSPHPEAEKSFLSISKTAIVIDKEAMALRDNLIKRLSSDDNGTNGLISKNPPI